jgi:hypothetical protein
VVLILLRDFTFTSWGVDVRETRHCPYCQTPFLPSAYRPQQRVCGQPDCQRRRRRDYHRNKLATDSVYRQGVKESQKQWREEHPGYQQQYWKDHPQAAERNRQQQQVRDHHRRLRHLVKNNLALDLKHSAAEVWLLAPNLTKLHDLEKNNLASAQVLILPSVVPLPVKPSPS